MNRLMKASVSAALMLGIYGSAMAAITVDCRLGQPVYLINTTMDQNIQLVYGNSSTSIATGSYKSQGTNLCNSSNTGEELVVSGLIFKGAAASFKANQVNLILSPNQKYTMHEVGPSHIFTCKQTACLIAQDNITDGKVAYAFQKA